MKGIDTNILIRLLTQDDAAQTQAVQRLAEYGEDWYVNIIVLCEAVWVLKKAYGFSKADIIKGLKVLMETRHIVMEDEDAVEQALSLYQRQAADLPDILIGLRNHNAGCTATLTFDKTAAALDEFMLLA